MPTKNPPSEAEKVFQQLKKIGLIAEVYDQEINKKVFMLTPKGAEWFTFLSKVYGKAPKSQKKEKKFSPEKGWNYWINLVMNKIIDVMEAIAKFGRSIDKSTGGKPKKQGDMFKF